LPAAIDHRSHGATSENDAFDAVERLLQDMLVEKGNRRQRLVLRGRGDDVLLDGQVCQETVDFGFGKFAWLVAIVKLDVSANPVDVGLFGTTAIVPDANHSTMWLLA
jgi:hypothetical protein